MSDNPYPNLGFNPVPGSVNDVAGMQGQINSAYEAVKETNGLLSRLRNNNDDVWKGDAGNAFRASFDATLAQDLNYAQSSLEKAVALIQEWHTNLVTLQETAKGLDTEAAAAKAQHTQAVATLSSAQSNPDLSLANHTYTDAESLRAAQTRIDAAVAQVRTASAAVDDWQSKIDAIIKRARDLETAHDTLARRIARELDAAAKDFAPSPPDKSIWDRITDAVKSLGEWIDEHREGIHQVLSIIAAVGSVVAVCTPPPIDAIGFAVAAAATGGLIALDLSDPEIRQGLANGDLSTWGKVGLDSLGIAPVGGAGIASAKVGWSLFKGGEAVAAGTHALQGVGVGERFGAAAYNAVTHEPLLSSKIVGALGGSKVAEVLKLDGAATKVLQLTGVAGPHASVAGVEAVDLFARSGKAVSKILDPFSGGDD
ncbi:hypothetical protein OG563_29295 [Nocardia vinacea]|uniref:WXG100 family type VII secretion target n=1 Tax=Nocardia vinacea TaxID=96468 RepID=A0ABZ1YJB2_9NOCA|nr:hypothetical protein [Nocardia vinacea]